MKTTIVKLSNISLLRMLSEINKRQVSGVIRVKQFSDGSSIKIWIWENSIVSVTGILTLSEKIEYYSWLNPKLINSLKNENLLQKDIGKKLLNVYNLTPQQVGQLFQEQIKELFNLFDIQTGTMELRKFSDPKLLPYSEMTGYSITIAEFIFQELKRNIDYYLEDLPDTCLTILSSTNNIEHIQLDRDTKNILDYADSNLSIRKIAKKLNKPRQEVQQKVYALQLMNFVDVGFPTNRLMQLALNTTTESNKERISFDAKSKNWKSPLIVFGGINLLTIILIAVGFFEGFEQNLLDNFFRLRGTTKNNDITIVTIDDKDIEQFPTYPIADEYLAQTLENITQHQPKIVGMDIYRNLPQPPGEEKLSTIYSNTNNLIGVKKVGGKKVSPPKILAEKNQVGFADLIVDSDGILRRSLMSVENENGQIDLSLGTYLALFSLSQDGVEMRPYDRDKYIIGKGRFQALNSQSGGYWQGNDFSGLQTLLNFRHRTSDFSQISFWEAYQNQIPPEIIENKIVIIGVTADSVKDFVFTPLSKNRTGLAEPIPGVVIHANVAAQLLNAANGKASMLAVLTKSQEILLIITASVWGMIIGFIVLEFNLKFIKEDSYSIVLIPMSVVFTIWLAIGYICFLSGLWIPTFTPILCSVSSLMLTVFQYKQELKRIVYGDRKTKTANRKYFDRMFNLYFGKYQENNQNFSVVFCRLNTKGDNPKSIDKLLKAIARETKQILSPNDILARYETNLLGMILEQTNYHQAEEFVQSLRKIINSISKELKITIDCDLGFSNSKEFTDSLDFVSSAYWNLDDKLY